MVNYLKAKRVKGFPSHLSPFTFHLKALVLCALLSGCKAGRQSRAEYRAEVVSGIEKRDTVHVQRFMQLLKNRQTEIRHVAFLPPDSTGRQFIQSAYHVSINEETTADESTDIESRVSTQINTVSTEELTEAKEFSVERKRGGLYWVLLFLLVGGGLYVLVRKEKR